jgi:DNA modification methylase
MESRRNRSQMSSFGTSKRESHDSTAFYSRKLYEAASINEKLEEFCNPLPANILDRVLLQDSKNMSNLPDSSIHLMVTSPPYNVGKEYDENLDLDSYFDLLDSVFRETYRVLVPGGRVCINIANVGRKPYIAYHKFVIDSMLQAKFLMRGEIIWDKGAGAGSSTAWGSWKSASNPTLRDVHEYILVFSKQKFSRDAVLRKSDISREEFLEYSKSVWRFNPESARRLGHPAPFPVELPLRCLKFYTFRGDIVLDPFCGVGSTCLAAMESGRHFVGMDNNPGYVRKASKRIREYSQGTFARTQKSLDSEPS